MRKIVYGVAILALMTMCACAGKTTASSTLSASEPKIEESVSLDADHDTETSTNLDAQPEKEEEPALVESETSTVSEADKEPVWVDVTDDEVAEYLKHLSMFANDTDRGNLKLIEDGLFVFYYECDGDFKVEDAVLQFKYKEDEPEYVDVYLTYNDTEKLLGTYCTKEPGRYAPYPQFSSYYGIDIGDMMEYDEKKDVRDVYLKGYSPEDGCLIVDFGTDIVTIETGNIKLDGNDGVYEKVEVAEDAVFVMLALDIESVYTTPKYLEELPYAVLCNVCIENGKVVWVYQIYVS
ncbi:MAG: hypothetical protein J5717_06260 [Lachnospiraceae bacterium]|nr:hypothetical protein [Lachnospiraceae bacterium]